MSEDPLHALKAIAQDDEFWAWAQRRYERVNAVVPCALKECDNPHAYWQKFEPVLGGSQVEVPLCLDHYPLKDVLCSVQDCGQPCAYRQVFRPEGEPLSRLVSVAMCEGHYGLRDIMIKRDIP